MHVERSGLASLNCGRTLVSMYPSPWNLDPKRGADRAPCAAAAACSATARRDNDTLFGPEPKLVALHGAPGPVVVRCAFQAKLGELVGDKARPKPRP